jgi:hypothetical protein
MCRKLRRNVFFHPIGKALSGLDRFITLIQASLPLHERAMLFRDSIFRGLLQSITTYYHAIEPNILTVPELKCNAALRSARQPIEKITALPAVFKEFATPEEVISWQKTALMHWSNSGFVTY